MSAFYYIFNQSTLYTHDPAAHAVLPDQFNPILRVPTSPLAGTRRPLKSNVPNWTPLAVLIAQLLYCLYIGTAQDGNLAIALFCSETP